MGLGAVFVNQLVKWEAQLEQDLDKMLEKAKAANERRYFGTLCSRFSVLFTLQSILYLILWLASDTNCRIDTAI